MEPTPQIAKLREAIACGQAVFITGTGVSMAACGRQKVEGHEVASWVGVLEHGANHLKTIGAADDKAIGRLIDNIRSSETDFMISAGEMIENRMRKKSDGAFRGWMKDTIGQWKVQNSSLLEALQHPFRSRDVGRVNRPLSGYALDSIRDEKETSRKANKKLIGRTNIYR